MNISYTRLYKDFNPKYYVWDLVGYIQLSVVYKGVRWPKRKLDSVVLVVTNIKTD